MAMKGFLILTVILLLSLPHTTAGHVNIPASGPGKAVMGNRDSRSLEKHELHKQRRKLSFREEMVAGAIARAAAQWVVFPADAWKTLRQTRGAAKGVSKLPPLNKLVGGATTTSAMALPAGAIQFSVFHWAKQALRTMLPSSVDVTFVELAASTCASLCSLIVQGPQELIKQRIQSGIYPSFRSGVASVMKESGLLGFYQGILPTMARNTPMVCLTFTAFARLKAAYQDKYGAPPRGAWPMILGALAAGVSCVITQPIDVVKTRLLTQAASNLAPYTGARDCIARMLTEEGVSAFYRGIVPRLFYTAPFAAVQFAVHEGVSMLLQALHK